MRRLALVTLALALALAAACEKKDDAAPAAPVAEAPAAPAAPAAVPTSVVQGPLGDVLKAYEGARNDLAWDKADVSGHADALIAAATAGNYEGLKTAATALKNTPSADIEAVRVAYGDVSKAVIELVAVDENAKAGRYVFECPMAKGYKKWLQESPTMANPYMGQKMLECGTAMPIAG